MLTRRVVDVGGNSDHYVDDGGSGERGGGDDRLAEKHHAERVRATNEGRAYGLVTALSRSRPPLPFPAYFLGSFGTVPMRM